MGDKKHDRAAIEKAAGTVAQEDYPHLKAAVEYAKQYTALGENAFGAIPSRFLMPRYNPARDNQVQNLDDGLKKLEEAIKGLSTVAYRMAATEAANTIDLTKVRKIKITKPPDVHLDKVPDYMPLVRMGTTALHLTSNWIASTFLKSSFSGLMLLPTATTLASLGMWLSIQPDDEEIGTVMAGWSTVADELGHVNSLGRMASDGDPLPRSVWDDDARNAFDRWALNFQHEVAQAADEARGAIRTLDDTLLAIQEIQRLMIGYDEFTAVALATLAAVGLVPVLAGQARMAQLFIATFNRFATGVSVAAVTFQAIDYGTKMHQVSGAGAFHKLQINNDPKQPYGTDEVNDTFTDLDIDWLR